MASDIYVLFNHTNNSNARLSDDETVICIGFRTTFAIGNNVITSTVAFE